MSTRRSNRRSVLFRVSDDTARPIPRTICSEIPKTCANSNKKAEQQPTTTTTTPKKESCCKEKRTLQFPAHLGPFRWPTWEKHEKRVLQINNQLLRQQQQQQQKEVFPARDKPNLQNLFVHRGRVSRNHPVSSPTKWLWILEHFSDDRLRCRAANLHLRDFKGC